MSALYHSFLHCRVSLRDTSAQTLPKPGAIPPGISAGVANSSPWDSAEQWGSCPVFAAPWPVPAPQLPFPCSCQDCTSPQSPQGTAEKAKKMQRPQACPTMELLGELTVSVKGTAHSRRGWTAELLDEPRASTALTAQTLLSAARASLPSKTAKRLRGHPNARQVT